MEPIKPCPFCGNDDPYWDSQIIDGKEVMFLVCGDCGCEGPTHVDSSIAAERWNERV